MLMPEVHISWAARLVERLENASWRVVAFLAWRNLWSSLVMVMVREAVTPTLNLLSSNDNDLDAYSAKQFLPQD